jgi:hypothetical protein
MTAGGNTEARAKAARCLAWRDVFRRRTLSIFFAFDQGRLLARRVDCGYNTLEGTFNPISQSTDNDDTGGNDQGDQDAVLNSGGTFFIGDKLFGEIAQHGHFLSPLFIFQLEWPPSAGHALCPP